MTLMEVALAILLTCGVDVSGEVPATPTQQVCIDSMVNCLTEKDWSTPETLKKSFLECEKENAPKKTGNAYERKD